MAPGVVAVEPEEQQVVGPVVREVAMVVAAVAAARGVGLSAS